MSVMIWDDASQAFKETEEVPKRYDAVSGAWMETTGMAYDDAAGAWTERWSRVVYTIIVTTSALDGEAVTATITDESHTTTFVDGVAVFKVHSTGTVTITCDEYSTSVEVTGESESLELYFDEAIRFYVVKNGTIQNGCSVDWMYTDNGYFCTNRIEDTNTGKTGGYIIVPISSSSIIGKKVYAIGKTSDSKKYGFYVNNISCYPFGGIEDSVFSYNITDSITVTNTISFHFPVVYFRIKELYFA